MTKRERREAKAAASSAGSGGAGQIAVIVGIVVAIMLFTYTGGGAAQKKWNPAQGIVTDAYTLTEATDSQAAGSYAVIRYTEAGGTEQEKTALPLQTALDDAVGETVDIEYRSLGSVRVVGNYIESKDTTSRNLFLGIAAVVAVYLLSELIKKIFPPEMVYEKLRGGKKSGKNKQN